MKQANKQMRKHAEKFKSKNVQYKYKHFDSTIFITGQIEYSRSANTLVLMDYPTKDFGLTFKNLTAGLLEHFYIITSHFKAFQRGEIRNE